MKMREKLIKRLNELLVLIVKANDRELDTIGAELLEIEKKIMNYQSKVNKRF